MHSDFDDTVTAIPAEPEVPLQPDDESTVVRVREAPAASPGSPVLEEPPAPRLFYGFRVGASEVVLLDSTVYLGRRPTVPRVAPQQSPRLVRVLSPTQEVSSTHLELRQLGSTVVIRDLHSTNGTRVSIPGYPSRSLRPGESLVVTVGTLIDIGDRNVIEILPLQRAAR